LPATLQITDRPRHKDVRTGHALTRDSVWETLKAIRRLHGGVPNKRARPLTADELRGLLAFLDTHRPIDVRDRALIALGLRGCTCRVAPVRWAKYRQATRSA
jgi:integrase